MKNNDQIGNGIPWQEAQKWAEAHGMTEIIIVCGNGKTTNVLSWGKTPAESSNAAAGANCIKDYCWPEDVPHTQVPAWLAGLLDVWKMAKSFAEHRRKQTETQLIDCVNTNKAVITAKLQGAKKFPI